VTPDAVAFAQQWVEEWNSHDLDRILAHYAPDVIFRSRVAARVIPESFGVVRGLDALRAYWSAALAQVPDLHFEVVDICVGLDTLLIRFRNQVGAVRCEVLRFEDGLVVEGEGTDLVGTS
jgi:ketosteroid isomerase-like protein